MAAIGKIRSWGPWLVGIIGLALFGFIATDFTRSCEANKNESINLVGEVMGNKFTRQTLQDQETEFKYVLKAIGQDDAEDDQVKDYIWNQFVQNTIIGEEASKLGLEVTDDEFKALMADGTSPLFRQYAGMLVFNLPSGPVSFYNQQTNRFDATLVSQIYNELNAAAQQDPRLAEMQSDFDNYWKAMEKMLRQGLLVNKYQALLAASLLSNPVAAKASFDDNNVESTVVLASLAYNTINDNDITVSDADLKAKYDEQKERYKWNTETRDIKYVVCPIEPSAKDVENLRQELILAGEQLGQVKADSLSVQDVVSSHQSKVNYHGLGYTKRGLDLIVPGLAARVDTMSIGQTSEPFENGNTMTLVKVLNKFQDVDSLEYQAIMTAGQTMDAAKASADSIIALVNGGLPFDSVTFFGQPSSKEWIYSDQYQNAENISPEYLNFLNVVKKAEIGQLKTFKLAQGYMVYKVTQRRPTVQKYDVAVVQRNIEFSTETYNNTFNQFSKFISESANAAALEQNAPKYNYEVREQKNLSADAHTIGQVNYSYNGQRSAELPGTQSAVSWVFDRASEGSVSKLYDNLRGGKALLVVAVTKIHPAGYLDQASVADELRAEVIRDKKFEQLSKKFNGITSIDAAQQQGARVDTLTRVTFGHVTVNGVSDRRLSGAIVATPVNQFSKKVVKGDNAAYLFQVLSRKQREGTEFDAQATMQSNIRSNMSIAGYALEGIREKANIVDNRYKLYTENN